MVDVKETLEKIVPTSHFGILRCLITGGAGFIGSHLARRLKNAGHFVRIADIQRNIYFEEKEICDEFYLVDLRIADNAMQACETMDWVFHLAANMGGIGWIANNNAVILRDNLLISVNTLEAARKQKVKKLFFSSSACVYPEYRQLTSTITALKEDDVLPAQPQDSYGWEKLITEILCRNYMEDFGLEVRIARFHNIFFSHGTWFGGKEKFPLSLLRKCVIAQMTNDLEIEIWGDGTQTRSFLNVVECIEGVLRLMVSSCKEVINIGSDEMISINDMVHMVADFMGLHLQIKHIDGPLGVQGRNSDNTKIQQVLGWKPTMTLREGLMATLPWVKTQIEQMQADGGNVEVLKHSEINHAKE